MCMTVLCSPDCCLQVLHCLDAHHSWRRCWQRGQHGWRGLVPHPHQGPAGGRHTPSSDHVPLGEQIVQLVVFHILAAGPLYGHGQEQQQQQHWLRMVEAGIHLAVTMYHWVSKVQWSGCRPIVGTVTAAAAAAVAVAQDGEHRHPPKSDLLPLRLGSVHASSARCNCSSSSKRKGGYKFLRSCK
jgi:hypothetical protein